MLHGAVRPATVVQRKTGRSVQFCAFAPPIGVGYYAACAIGRVASDAAMRHIWPDLGALAIGLAIVAGVSWYSIGFLE